MGAAGFEEAREGAQKRPEPLTKADPPAHGSPEALTAGPGAALVAALARAAAAAADAGELDRARSLLEDAARALPQEAQGSIPPVLLVVTPGC